MLHNGLNPINTYNFAKVMFLHLFVSHSVHRGVPASVHAGIHTPPRQTPPQGRHPQGADSPPPWSRQPHGNRHPSSKEQTPPWEQTQPPGADTPSGSSHLPEQMLPPAQCMLGHTCNKRVLRILLECILVKICCLFLHQCIFTMHRMHNIIIDTSMKKPSL